MHGAPWLPREGMREGRLRWRHPQDMNGVAARALASVLLPSQVRDAAGSAEPACWVPGRAGRRLALVGDLVEHCCARRGYEMLALWALPQTATRSLEYCTFTWPALLKRLRQMLITGVGLEEGLDWSVQGGAGGRARSRPINKARGVAGMPSCAAMSVCLSVCLGSWLLSPLQMLAATLVLRGQGASEADVGCVADASLFAPWAIQPLMVSSNAAPYARLPMSATALTNCQVGLCFPQELPCIVIHTGIHTDNCSFSTPRLGLYVASSHTSLLCNACPAVPGCWLKY
jgi:tubulin delta